MASVRIPDAVPRRGFGAATRRTSPSRSGRSPGFIFCRPPITSFSKMSRARPRRVRNRLRARLRSCATTNLLVSACATSCAAVVFFACATATAATLHDPRLRFRTLSTTHFIIYYHQGEDPLAERLATIAEDTWRKLRQPLGATPPARDSRRARRRDRAGQRLGVAFSLQHDRHDGRVACRIGLPR